MANTNGVFSDLFNAVGTPIQNVADTVSNGIDSAASIAGSGINLYTTIISSTANAGIQLIQGVLTGITTAITPKK
ncbi:MAG: hypothetical protein HKK67_02010 [Chlorobiaceae bacterium]|jgi:chlorosome envelope protein F|nr:hypothetical protein [Chlorobiaceae bacterium]